LLLSILNWLLYSFFVLGAIGGVTYIVRLMFWNDRRVEVHHRYYQTPVYYGPGVKGDMAQIEEPEDRPAA